MPRNIKKATKKAKKASDSSEESIEEIDEVPKTKKKIIKSKIKPKKDSDDEEDDLSDLDVDDADKNSINDEVISSYKDKRESAPYRPITYKKVDPKTPIGDLQLDSIFSYAIQLCEETFNQEIKHQCIHIYNWLVGRTRTRPQYFGSKRNNNGFGSKSNNNNNNGGRFNNNSGNYNNNRGRGRGTPPQRGYHPPQFKSTTNNQETVYDEDSN